MTLMIFELFQFENLDFHIFGNIPLAFRIFPLYTPISERRTPSDSSDRAIEGGSGLTVSKPVRRKLYKGCISYPINEFSFFFVNKF